MWNVIIIIALVFIMVMGIIYIRSLIRKWKANPTKWFDLGIGILMWVAVFVILLLKLLEQLDVIGKA
jgi:DMSO reductase anchor subunit